MKSRIPIIWIIIFLFGLVQPLPLDSKVLVATTKDVVERYNKILDEQKTTLDGISHLKSKHAHRAVASMVIFLKALQVSESNIKTEFLIVPNNRRLKAVVESGGAVAGLADLWSATFDSNVYQSTAVIPSGNYFVGFYGLEENKNLLHLKEHLNFEKLTAVSSKGWVVDWHTLQQLNLKELHNVTDSETMRKVVKFRGFDFTLLAFPYNKDLSRKKFDITLVPAPGVKLALDGSRHFMVSKTHKDGKRVYKFLNLGLGILREKKQIRKFYEDVKFYRNDLADWKIISVK